MRKYRRVPVSVGDFSTAMKEHHLRNEYILLVRDVGFSKSVMKPAEIGAGGVHEILIGAAVSSPSAILARHCIANSE